MDRNELIYIYFHLDLPYKDIVSILSHDHSIFISERHLKRILANLRLTRRKSYASLEETVHHVSVELLHHGSLHGHKWMWQKLRDRGVVAKQETVRVILSVLSPGDVALRASRRLRRREYYARGPNFLWHCDSYDKLKNFGICVNGCVDGFSRKVVWLNAYFTSSDPRVIAGYFIESVVECNGTAAIIRTDRGKASRAKVKGPNCKLTRLIPLYYFSTLVMMVIKIDSQV